MIKIILYLAVPWSPLNRVVKSSVPTVESVPLEGPLAFVPLAGRDSFAGKFLDNTTNEAD